MTRRLLGVLSHQFLEGLEPILIISKVLLDSFIRGHVPLLQLGVKVAVEEAKARIFD